MSQHPSLRISGVGKAHRNVLKRYERVKKLAQDGRWTASEPVFGLPKVKSLKIKVRKKSDAAPKAAEGAGAAQPAAAAAAPAKPAGGERGGKKG